MLRNKGSYENSIDQMIEQHYGDIYRYVYCFVKNRDIAQDITQDVFLKFLKNIDAYIESGKLKNFLYVIAKNCVKDHLKKQKDISLDELSNDVEYSDKMANTEDRMTIMGALASLEPEEKNIIILKYFQQLKNGEIAEIYGKPVSTVRYMLKRAEKNLKKRLEGKI